MRDGQPDRGGGGVIHRGENSSDDSSESRRGLCCSLLSTYFAGFNVCVYRPVAFCLFFDAGLTIPLFLAGKMLPCKYFAINSNWTYLYPPAHFSVEGGVPSKVLPSSTGCF